MKKVRGNKLALACFLLPALILFTAIVIIPIFMSAYYSLLDWDGITESTFIGLENYKELFTSKSIRFPKAISNSLVIAVLCTMTQIPFGLMFALILSKKVKGEAFFVTVFFMPALISGAVIGQLWAKIYNPDYGILNLFLQKIGLESWCHVWLGEADTALIAVIIPIIWQFIGYHMLILYAGIKTISPELREAAKIDGATEGQVNRLIIIPLLKPVLKVCTVFAVTGSLKIFDMIYILTNGGPAHASEVPSTLLVNMLFWRNKYGLGSAVAVFIIFLCFFFALLIQRVFRTEESR